MGTAADYLRFLEALRLGRGVLSPTLARFMVQDHLGSLYLEALKRGPEYLRPGYGFGLGVAVRVEPMGYSPGSVGEWTWAGFGGTFFFVDPA